MGLRKLLVLSLFLTLFFSTLEAAQFNVNRAKIRLSVPAGDSQAGEIKIDNFTSEEIKVRAYLEDWIYNPAQDGSKSFSPSGSHPLSAAKWISFSPAEFTILPFSSRNVNYVVKVPADAQGGYQSILFFESFLPESVEKELVGEEVRRANINIAVRIGSLFFVEAKGKVKRAGEISQLNISGNQNEEPLSISLDFKNSGNVDLTASGSFDIIDKEGVVQARGEFNKVYTLPQDKGTLKAEWKEGLMPGLYDAVFTIDIGKAQEETGFERGPVITKETQIEIGSKRAVVKVGELK